MKRTGSLLLALGLGLSIWAGLAGTRRSRPLAAVHSTNPVLTPDPRPAERERDLERFHKRLTEDPYSAADHTTLALLYFERARATGSYEDVVLAESNARESLALRSSHNSAPYLVLAYSLLDQHRFQEAYDAATILAQLDPQPAHVALRGETLMELGRYDAAAAVFRSLQGEKANLAVLPRLARWEEIAGRRDHARELLYRARDLADKRSDLNPEQRVVFQFRIGEFELRNGRLEAAETAFNAGLAVRPGDYRIIAQQARLEALRRNWPLAIELGSEAISHTLEPGTLGLISDAYAMLGDTASAGEFMRAMEVTVLGQQRSFHREWSHFLLDHEVQFQQVHEEATRDLRQRTDIYGYDLIAWALYKQKKYADAKSFSLKALQLGTQDASLYYHAGMIEVALGNGKAGARHLKHALKLNKTWHYSQPDQARAVLDSLGWFP